MSAELERDRHGELSGAFGHCQSPGVNDMVASCRAVGGRQGERGDSALSQGHRGLSHPILSPAGRGQASVSQEASEGGVVHFPTNCPV